MKKIYFLIFIFMLSTFAVSAQETTTESDDTEEQVKKLKSGFELDYLVYNNEGAISAALVLGGLVLSGDYVASTEAIEGVKSKSSWHLGVGLNKRIHIVRNKFFVEGRIGATYRYTGVKYETGYTDEMLGLSDSGFGYYLYPRVTVAVINKMCIAAGYKLDFQDFKLSKDYLSTCFTAGISFLF